MEKDFDKVAAEFTARVTRAAAWKHSYGGACFATRIRSAIDELNYAIAEAQKHPEIGRQR